MTTRAQIVSAAYGWIDTPFRHQGRTAAGLDCVGLLIRIANDLGITDYDETGYSRRPNDSFIEKFRENMDPIFPLASAKDGDVLIFSEGGSLCHCGIKVTVDGKPGLIHSAAVNRSVLEETLSDALDECGKPRFAFRFRGLED